MTNISPDFDNQLNLLSCSLEDFRLVLAIFESGSFLKASMLLKCTTKIAKSRLARLESRLGIQLFARRQSNLIALKPAFIIHLHAKKIIHLQDLFQGELSKMVKEM